MTQRYLIHIDNGNARALCTGEVLQPVFPNNAIPSICGDCLKKPTITQLAQEFAEQRGSEIPAFLRVLSEHGYVIKLKDEGD